MKELLTFLAMIAYSLLGNSAMAAQPMIVGGLVDFSGLSERQAGFVSASEMSGFAFGMLALLRYIVRFDRRLVAVAAVAVIVTANSIAAFATTFEQMLFLRFCSGFGAAMAYSVFLTIAAGSAKPQRSFAVVNATSIAFTGGFLWVAPYILAEWQLAGLFLTIVVLAVVISLSTYGVPRVRDLPAEAIVELPSADDSGADAQKRFAIGLVLMTMFALYVGHGAVWSYQERIGVEMGMLAESVGTLLGTSMLIWGVLGSLVASVLGLSFGRVWPQIISLSISIAAALMLVLTKSPLGFGVACGLIAFSWFYGLPYQMGLLADFDPFGRANLAGSLMTTFGAAVGPATAALLLGWGGYLGIGLLAGGCYAIAMLLVLPAALKVSEERSRRLASPVGTCPTPDHRQA